LPLGTIGFGGPIALAGYMQKGLVEDRGWFSPQDYLQGLAFCQLSPGPLAAQLAVYLGWLRAGLLGATLTGVAFILPSFLMVVVLAAFYVKFGSLPWIHGMFYGIGAAVIAIIARSAVKMLRGTVGKDRLLWAIFLALAITTAWTHSEIVWLFLLCGVVAMVVEAPPRLLAHATPVVLPGLVAQLMTGSTGVAVLGTLGVLFLFFVKAGAFVFGSGRAIVPYIHR
jgi:chromate transporter